MPDRFARPIHLNFQPISRVRAEPDRGPKFRTVSFGRATVIACLSPMPPRRNFKRNARSCSASSRRSGPAALCAGRTINRTSWSTSGRNYTELPNAFRYRKSLISGCACKPMPWSEEALARHRQYAEAEARKSGEQGR